MKLISAVLVLLNGFLAGAVTFGYMPADPGTDYLARTLLWGIILGIELEV